MSERFEMAGGWEVGVRGGGYDRGHGLHGALGVVEKIMKTVFMKIN